MSSSSAYPLYSSYAECVLECGSIVSYCAGGEPLVVCQISIATFLAVIFMAIFTGISLPLSVLVCWANGWRCRRQRDKSATTDDDDDSPCRKSARRWRRGTNATDDEHASLCPAKQSMKARTGGRQPSTCSLPIANEVIYEEDEAAAGRNVWAADRRVRKITFDLSHNSSYITPV